MALYSTSGNGLNLSSKYRALVEALRKPAVLTMALSAGVQQNIALSKDEIVKALNVFSKLSCLSIALSANMPLFMGERAPVASSRAFYAGASANPKKYFGGISKEKRVGRLPNIKSLDDYFRWLINLTYLIHVDGEGNILEDLQDPNGNYPMNTCITETDNYLYIGSLFSSLLARLSKKEAL